MYGIVDSKIDVFFNLAGGWEFVVVWGGLGYVVVVLDFLGFGDFWGFYFYVYVDMEVLVGIDMLFVVWVFCESEGLVLNDQLFVIGYFQGGYVVVAVYCELEVNYIDEFIVIVFVFMFGFYSIFGVMCSVLFSDEFYFYQGYLVYIVFFYNEVYGFFDSVEVYFKLFYVELIEQFYQGDIIFSILNSIFIDLLIINEGVFILCYMLQDFLFIVLEDENSDYFILQVLEDNDVYDWVLQVLIWLYYCIVDDQVVFINSIFVDLVMNVNGVLDVFVVDVGMIFNYIECVQLVIVVGVIFFLGYCEFIFNIFVFILDWNLRVFFNLVSNILYLWEFLFGIILQLMNMNGQIMFE